MAKNTRYTYVSFGNEVVDVVASALTNKLIDAMQAERMIDKANALIATQEKKSTYNAANPKKSTPKGASEKTQAVANALASVLTDIPMTTAELNEALGTTYTPLQVSNAIKFVPNWAKETVVRDVVSPKGLKSQKEYTAYKVVAESEEMAE